MSDQVTSVLTFLGLVVSVAAFYFPFRRSIRNDKASRLRQAEQDRLQAIRDAEQPLKDRISELQAANTQALETQGDNWQARLADRDRELAEKNRTIDALTSERDHYRDLWDNRDTHGVNLAKPKDRP